MPDEPAAAPVATEAPPPPAEAPAVPAAPAEAPEAPTELVRPKRSVEEQKASLRGRRWRQTADQPRDESGRFQPTPPPEDVRVQEPPTEPQPEPPPDDGRPAPSKTPTETPAPEPPPVPEGYVRIEVPEGHPLRTRGTHRVVPKEDEEYFRWGMNNHVRESTAREAEQRAQELQRQLQESREQGLRHQAELNALKEQTAELYGDPKILERAKEIRETWGDEDAERYLAGALAGYQDRSAKAYEELTVAERTRVVQAEANQFTTQATELYRQRYPGWSPDRYRKAIVAYGAMLEANGQNAADISEFQQMTDAQYYNDPQIRQRFQAYREQKQNAERETVRKEEVERLRAEQQKQREEAEINRQKYPFMRMPANAAPARVGVPSVDRRPVSVTDQKRRLFGRGARTG